MVGSFVHSFESRIILLRELTTLDGLWWSQEKQVTKPGGYRLGAVKNPSAILGFASALSPCSNPGLKASQSKPSNAHHSCFPRSPSWCFAAVCSHLRDGISQLDNQAVHHQRGLHLHERRCGGSRHLCPAGFERRDLGRCRRRGQPEKLSLEEPRQFRRGLLQRPVTPARLRAAMQPETFRATFTA